MEQRALQRDERLFSLSILLSATRCLLSYVVLPLLSPVFGAATGLAEPLIGLPVGLVALAFDLLAIRRFRRSNYAHRRLIVGFYLAVIALVSVLLVRDILDLLGL